MMNDKKTIKSAAPPMRNDSGLKEYRCPHCEKFLFKGNVKRLSMVCYHCQTMIDADHSELFNLDRNEE